MALRNADRVKETSTTTGTGTYSLAGAVAGFRTFVAGVGNANQCHYVATDGTDWEVGIGTVTDGAPDTLARTVVLDSSNAGAAVSWAAGTRDIFCANIADAEPGAAARSALTADYTNNSTTGTEVTGLSRALQPGTYVVSYHLIARSAATATGLALGINFTGTHTALVAHMQYPGTGAAASTGIIDDDSAGATDQLVESFVTRTESTTAPDLGPLTGFATANVDCYIYVAVVIVVTVAGDLELWCASEVAASEVRLQAGSSIIVEQTN